MILIDLYVCDAPTLSGHFYSIYKVSFKILSQNNVFFEEVILDYKNADYNSISEKLKSLTRPDFQGKSNLDIDLALSCVQKYFLFEQ